MKNISRKVVGILLILMLVSSPVISLAVDAEEQRLNNQKSSNNEEIKEVETEKEKVTAEKNETAKQVSELDSQIDEYEGEIQTLDGQISEANAKIQDTTAKLSQAQKDYENQQKILEERIIALYEAGETNYLDVLLSSDNVTDFISSYYVISEIAECDVSLLDEIDKKKNEIEKTKKELEESKEQLTTARTSKKDIAAKLETARAEKQEKVNQLSEDEKKLQDRIDEIKRDNVAIDQQILAHQAAVQEALRKMQERQNQANKTPSNGSTASGGSASSGSSAPSTSTSSSGFIYPVPGAYATVTTGWYYSTGAVHGAVDFGCGGISGQPVYAVADGVVSETHALTTSYGNYVVIAHPNGLYTLYAHGQAGSICVSQGEEVKQGQQIMRVGSTGNSSGPHLHFEVRTAPGTYSNRRNPYNYLP